MLLCNVKTYSGYCLKCRNRFPPDGKVGFCARNI